MKTSNLLASDLPNMIVDLKVEVDHVEPPSLLKCFLTFIEYEFRWIIR